MYHTFSTSANPGSHPLDFSWQTFRRVHTLPPREEGQQETLEGDMEQRVVGSGKVHWVSLCLITHGITSNIIRDKQMSLNGRIL